MFDPATHLQLEKPDWVTQLPDFSRCDQVEGGRLAYSAPMQLLSAAGVEVMRKIVAREKPESGPSRGARVALRGLYYTSPWVTRNYRPAV